MYFWHGKSVATDKYATAYADWQAKAEAADAKARERADLMLRVARVQAEVDKKRIADRAREEAERLAEAAALRDAENAELKRKLRELDNEGTQDWVNTPVPDDVRSLLSDAYNGARRTGDN